MENRRGIHVRMLDYIEGVFDEDREKEVSERKKKEFIVSFNYKVKGSFKDNRGKLVVDCAECVRGGNGDKDCSAGWRFKTIHKGSCFSGELLAEYDEKADPQLK